MFGEIPAYPGALAIEAEVQRRIDEILPRVRSSASLLGGDISLDVLTHLRDTIFFLLHEQFVGAKLSREDIGTGYNENEQLYFVLTGSLLRRLLVSVMEDYRMLPQEYIIGPTTPANNIPTGAN